jgi:hypothetical protein
VSALAHEIVDEAAVIRMEQAKPTAHKNFGV